MRRYDKGTFQEISAVLGLINTFTAEGFLETRPFMHLSKHIFRSI